MKKCLMVLIMGLAILGLGIDGIAETEPKSVWELGLELSSITYEEPGVMEETGTMFGILGSYTYYENDFMGKIELRYATGDVDYEGETQGGTPLKMSDIPNIMKEFRLLGGIKVGQSKKPPILYTGLGSRSLNDDSSSKVGGYERQSYYRYMPLGIDIDISNDRTNAWITVEYDIFLGGTQTSYLSDADPGLNDIKNKQDDGYGFKCSIGLETKDNAVGEFFIRTWNIKDSDLADVTYYGTTIGQGYEPKNNSLEIGISWAFRF